ncbi:MAG: MmgE/PrpD family protein [Proteobacteria bacterium]|nr:MmgE/PrpD family protein [Pseudomonadota bacterium]
MAKRPVKRNAKPKPYTRTLSDFLHKITYADLPSDVVGATKQYVLDYLGYTMASVHHKPALILQKLVAQEGACTDATIIGTKQRASTSWAALVNGCMGHMTELDDTHRFTQSHPGDAMIAAGLAVAETEGASGKDLIAAMVCGYDCAIRAGVAVMPSHYTNGWHPSGTHNAFGAAVTSAKLMGLSGEQQLHALGLAGTQTAGNFAHVPNRGMSKDLNPGKAAFNGVFSAQLARAGFTGSFDIFESAKGYLKLYSDTPHPERLTEKLGKPFRIGETAHKAFPGCFHLHGAREAAFRLAQRYKLTAEAVKAITINMFAIGAWYVDDPKPWVGNKGLYGPRFSAQFQVALALCEGEEGLWATYDDTYTLKMLENKRVRDVMARIRLIHDQKLAKTWPNGWPTVVQIKTTKGRTHKMRIDLPKGEPENPMSQAEIERKFDVCTGAALSAAKRAEIKKTVNNLEKVKNVADLMRLVRA